MDNATDLPEAALSEISVHQFKSFEHAVLRPRDLTLLIGPNASGKSNLIEALRLVSWLSAGQRLSRFDQAAQSQELPIRGRASDLPLDGAASFDIECKFSFSTRDYMNSVDTLAFTIGLADQELRITSERLGNVMGQEPLYEILAPAKPPGHNIDVGYHHVQPAQVRVVCNDQQLVLTQPAALEQAYQAQNGSTHVLAASRAECLQRIRFLDPVPARMRGYVSQKASWSDDAAPLSAILFDLCEAQARSDEVLEFVRALPEGEIDAIRFDEAPPDEVRLKLVERFAGASTERDARLLSDGTLRTLAVAAAVLSAPSYSLVVIEEVDSGVHPSRAKALLESIWRAAHERNLSVLLTSHNPALADALPLEAVPNTAYCYRDPATGHSTILHLHDIPHYAQLVAQGPVGLLMTKGIIERALKDSRTAEQRKRDALAWVEGLHERQP